MAIALRKLELTAPLRWLRLGARDFARAPFIGLFFGACFMVMGWALRAVYAHAPAYLLALAAGFLLVAPLLCLGLYRVSQVLERGERPDFGDALLAFEARIGPLALFGLLLLVLEMIWARSAMVLVAVSFDGLVTPPDTLAGWIAPELLGFVAAYMAVGAVFATLIYGLTAVAMPMLLDRPVDAVTAALTSLRLVLGQPLVMGLWAALIAGLTGLALLPWFAGLLGVAPWLGHASWHAYREAVLSEETPPAPPNPGA